MSDLLRLQDALIKAQRWHEAKTITATIKTIEALQARIAELEAPVTDAEIVLMIKALEHQSALLPAACYGSAAKLITRLQAKVEELEHELNDARSNRMPT